MTERKRSIKLALSIIEKTCITFNIAIYTKEIEGRHLLAIRDGETGKDYFLTKGDTNE